jgi:hypothetical protein
VASGEGFSTRDRNELERAIRIAEELSGLTFSTYVGPVDGPSRAVAERLHAALPDPARSVFILVDPKGRRVEVVTGEQARHYLTDADCQLVVLGMRSSFADGDLVGGLVTGIQQLGEHASRPGRTPLPEE